MITPAFGLTATERVLPKLALDFTTGTFDSRITFTRALNTATVIGSNGLLQTVNADIPRFDYNPTTLACKGLLIEESSTNLLTYSEDFSNAAWSTKTNITVAPSATVDPAGGTGAFTLTATSTNAVFGKTFTGTAGLPYTFSFWIRRKTGTGSITAVSGDLNYQTITSQVTSSWNRVSVPSLGTSTTTIRAYIVLASSGDEVEIYGAQSEQKAFGTSYIPNLATGTTTRNADVATMTGTNFSDWYNASEGVFVADFSSVDVGSGRFPNVITASNGTTAERIFLALNAGARRAAVYSSSANQYDITGGTIGTTTANAFNRLAVAYKVNDFTSAAMGSLSVTDTSGVTPTVDKLNLGSSATSTNPLNGNLIALRFYPQRLINAEVQAFSK